MTRNFDTGADCEAQDVNGKCPFDYIRDTEEWIDSGFFSEAVRARLKGTSNYIVYGLSLKCTLS